jgi:nucleoid DNA-binding protein
MFQRDGVPLRLSTRSALGLRKSLGPQPARARGAVSRADARRALAALDEIVLEELGNAQKVRVGGLVQLTVRVRAAQKKHKGRDASSKAARTRM